MLEPLSKVLGVSIIELIEGERITKDEHNDETEVAAKTVINYSNNEIKSKVRTTRNKYLGIAAACFVFVIVICSFLLWRGGYFYVIDKNTSPDGAFSIAVYNRELSGIGFSGKDATSIIVKASDNEIGEWRTTYGDCDYQGTWWAPDSKKYVIALKYDERDYLALDSLEYNNSSNLSAYLSMGVAMNELAEYAFQYTDDSMWPHIEYRFLQWSADSTSMLIYYSFIDASEATHYGYFWYNCEDGTVYAPFELDASN